MKVVEWFKNNLGGLIVGALVVGLILGLMWPKKEARIKDGEAVAVETKLNKYTADFMYEKLKVKTGLSTLLQYLDGDIINDKYGASLDEEARASALEEAESYINQYKLYYQMDEEAFLSQNGFKDKEEFIQNLMVNYKINYYVNEYVSETIKSDELKSFYNDSVFGEKTVTLISSSTNSDDVSKAQKELKKGIDISKVKNKYSSLAYNDLTITYDIQSNFSTTIINAIKNLKSKSVSDVMKDDTYGTVAIYVSSSKDKPSYEESVDGIKKTLSEKMQSEDQTLYYKAMMKLRNDYGIKFYDSDYEKYYNNFNKQFASK